MQKLHSIAILTTLYLSSLPATTIAQKKVPAAEYDYRPLALTSIAEITTEASKLSDVPLRVKVLLDAAKILQVAKKDEAIRLLEVSLRDLKEWEAADGADWRRRNTAAALRTEALATLALVDSEKALLKQKEFESSEKDAGNSNSTALNFKTKSWLRHFTNRRTGADQQARLALSLIDSEPDQALKLVVQSLQDATVSGVLFEITEKLMQSGNRPLLDRFEKTVAVVLAASVSLDPASLDYASTLGLVDSAMRPDAKRAFASFLLRSLHAWATVAKEPGTDTYYITRGFASFSGNIRYLISQQAPDELLEFDLVLDQMAPLVPENMRSIVERVQPEKFLDPKERLDDILRDSIGNRRDLRLIRLVSQLLRSEFEQTETGFDLAADAINSFTDADIKAAFTDLLTTKRVDALLKQKKIVEAQERAASIASEDTRAWALLAIATAASTTDKVLGFESITKALKALDHASPSPYKVELALLATAMLVKADSRRAFETFSTAAKYANASKSKEPSEKPPVAFGLETRIGDRGTRLGVVPPSLSEVKIDSRMSALAVEDWFGADQVTRGIQDPSLRLRLRLLFAEAVLTGETQRTQRKAK
jgi:hypothetical protein